MERKSQSMGSFLTAQANKPDKIAKKNEDEPSLKDSSETSESNDSVSELPVSSF